MIDLVNKYGRHTCIGGHTAILIFAMSVVNDFHMAAMRLVRTMVRMTMDMTMMVNMMAMWVAMIR